MRYIRSMSVYFGSALCIVAIVAAFGLSIGSVADACVIGWSIGSANPVLSADTNGAFGGTGAPFEMETTVLIYPPGESAFTLRLAYTSGTSTNIASCSVSPNQHLNAGDADGEYYYSHLTGILSTITTDGTAVISAWNVEHPELCSNTHYRGVDTAFD